MPSEKKSSVKESPFQVADNTVMVERLDFTFDRIFSDTSTQEEIFLATGKLAVKEVMVMMNNLNFEEDVSSTTLLTSWYPSYVYFM